MELFKFIPVTGPTVLEQGTPINGTKKVTWVERYSTPGEFTIEAKLSSGLKEFLPAGTLISHQDTMEVMVVQNHDIPENANEDTDIKITGQSFISFLDERAVGVNSARAGTLIAPYTVSAANSWEQVVTMINDHIVSPPCDADDEIPNFSANHSLSGGTGITSVDRPIKFGSLLKNILEILKVDDLGIKTIRRNPFGVTGGSSTGSKIHIYKGVDKTKTVMFSWITGDIQTMNYLFSRKKLKTSALVVGRFLNIMVDLPFTDYNRRIMVIDAQDIDQALTYPPAPVDVAAAIAAMQVRGEQALAGQLDISITQVDLGQNQKYAYRTDYNLGDLVSINGNFGEVEVVRVSEYAEIEDENGVTGHPTLTIPGV